jgi:hypothetical protein
VSSRLFLHEAKDLHAGGVGIQPVQAIVQHLGMRLQPNNQQHLERGGRGHVGRSVGQGAARREPGDEIAGDERFARTDIASEQGQFAPANAAWPDPVRVGGVVKSRDLPKWTKPIRRANHGGGVRVEGHLVQVRESGGRVEGEEVVWAQRRVVGEHFRSPLPAGATTVGSSMRGAGIDDRAWRGEVWEDRLNKPAGFQFPRLDQRTLQVSQRGLFVGMALHMFMRTVVISNQKAVPMSGHRGGSGRVQSRTFRRGMKQISRGQRRSSLSGKGCCRHGSVQ